MHKKEHFNAITHIVGAVLALAGLVVLVVSLIGPSLDLATLALGLLSVPTFTRLIRGSVLVCRELMFVEAARSIGCSPRRVLIRHVLPNSLTPIIIQASLQSASALLLLAGLSFLGLGAQPPTPEWGVMLADGKRVENFAFLETPPLGTWNVYVNLFDACTKTAVEFELSIYQRVGNPDGTFALTELSTQRVTGQLLRQQSNGGAGNATFVTDLKF